MLNNITQALISDPAIPANAPQTNQAQLPVTGISNSTCTSPSLKTQTEPGISGEDRTPASYMTSISAQDSHGYAPNFDPAAEDVCVCGQSIQTVIDSITNSGTDSELLLLRSEKERADRKTHVTVAINATGGDFSQAKQHALYKEHHTPTAESKMAVLVFGTGSDRDKNFTTKSIKNARFYEKLAINLIAFHTESEQEAGVARLKALQQQTYNPYINEIKHCNWDDIEKAGKHRLKSDTLVSCLQTLWEESSTIGDTDDCFVSRNKQLPCSDSNETLSLSKSDRKFIEYTYDLSRNELNALEFTFNPAGRHNCASGKIFNSIINGITTIPDNPGNHIRKRFGPHQTVTDLNFQASNYLAEIEKSKNLAIKGNPATDIRFIPIVVIGEGLGEGSNDNPGFINNTRKYYNGLHPRVIAAEDEDAVKRIINWFTERGHMANNPFIGRLRVCYFNDLIESSEAHTRRGQDLPAIWNNSKSLTQLAKIFYGAEQVNDTAITTKNADNNHAIIVQY